MTPSVCAPCTTTRERERGAYACVVSLAVNIAWTQLVGQTRKAYVWPLDASLHVVGCCGTVLYLGKHGASTDHVESNVQGGVMGTLMSINVQ